MRFLLRHLSLSYARRHRSKTLLTLLGVIVGVATFTAIQSARKTLIEGLHHTVDRMAGKAHLQISADGGVPEELLEELYELEGVRATAPVIQQIVVPERSELGSLLVLGVDLLGDREMREYGFSGEDVDLDDPLLFLAQADSMAVASEFAERAGLAVGDPLTFRTAQGLEKTVVVRGLLEPQGFVDAYGGNVAVLDVYAAQALFGRGRRFDRIEVRLEKGVELEVGESLLAGAVGHGYRIETPARRSAQMEALIANFAAGFGISSGFALAIGTFLIFNAFSVSVNRRRRDIGTLRALGATPRQVQLLFLSEALVVGAVGGAIGIAAGALLSRASLDVMSDTVATIYGFHDASVASLDPAVIVQSMILGIVASLAGAWEPARAAASVRPTEALARGRFRMRVPAPSAIRLGLGVGALVVAAVLALWRPFGGQPLVATCFLLGLVAVLLLTAPLARLLLDRTAPYLARMSPVTGLLAVDSLRSNPRRTSATVVAMTLSLAFVVGTGGYIDSTNATLSRWLTDLLTSDLYVRASANLVRPDFRFPPELKAELLALDGVRAVESFRSMRVPYGDDELLLLTIEIDAVMKRTEYEFHEGDRESFHDGLVNRKMCAISDNFARRFGLSMGDVVELETPSGRVAIPVAAVISEYSSDRGSAYLDRAFFVELFGDERVDTYDLSVEPGVDPHDVRGAVRELLGGRMPALISTQEEFKSEIGSAIDAFYVMMRVTLLLALAVAFLGIISSLFISVAERSREIGILKALGALPAQIRWSVVYESQAIAIVALVLALPFGFLEAIYMTTTVAEIMTGWRMPHRFPVSTLLQVMVALPLVSALAAWLPARIAAATPVTESIEYE